MTRQQLFQQILQKRSYLCVGLDSDINRIPKHLLKYDDPVFEFNKQIIDATKDYCVAYKPNTAFYESRGAAGWRSLEKTIEYIPDTHFTIADAKRGDIGNTSTQYAKAFFENMDFDSITVAPYMGIDSVAPFLEFENKWVILLALTSNKGSQDFQYKDLDDEPASSADRFPLFEKVMRVAQKWGSDENLMFVVGATHPEMFQRIRDIAPDHFLLVPGVGAQGGDLQKISEFGMNAQVGLLVNSSRSIIFAGDGEDFAAVAGEVAKTYQVEMAGILEALKVVAG